MKTTIRAWMIVGVCGLCLGACDRGTPATRAADKAVRDLTAMSSGGSAPAPESVRQQVYTRVATDLQGVANDAAPGEKSALMLLITSAHAGLGEIPAAEVEQHETAARHRTARIDSHLNRWALANATATAAEAFDPSGELARVARAKTARDADIVEQTRRRAEVQTRLTDLRTRTERAMGEAAKRQDEYTKLMDQASRLSATDGENLVVRANEVRLAGERFRLEGAKLEAETDSVTPVFEEIAAILDKLTKQRADLDEVETALNRQAADARREGSEARAAAAAVAVEIEREANDLDQFRTGTLAPAYDRALGVFDKALRAAKGVTAQDSPSAGKAAVMTSNLALAELFWARASSADSYASILRTLTRLSPALPSAGAFRTRLESATQERKDSLAKANEHLDAAITDARAVRATGAVKERLDALAALLEDAKRLANDERLDASSPLAPPAWLQESLARAAGASPERAFDAMLAAIRARNAEGVVDLMNLPSDRARQAMVPMVRTTFVATRSDEIARDKYGKSMGDLLASAGGMGAMIGPMLAQTSGQGVAGFGPDAIKGLTSDGVTWDIGADRATASGDALTEPVTFVKRNDTWKLLLPPEVAQMTAQAPMLAPMLKALTDAFEAWNAAAERDEYADADAAAKGLLEKLEPALGAMMGGPGGN